MGLLIDNRPHPSFLLDCCLVLSTLLLSLIPSPSFPPFLRSGFMKSSRVPVRAQMVHSRARQLLPREAHSECIWSRHTVRDPTAHGQDLAGPENGGTIFSWVRFKRGFKEGVTPERSLGQFCHQSHKQSRKEFSIRRHCVDRLRNLMWLCVGWARLSLAGAGAQDMALPWCSKKFGNRYMIFQCDIFNNKNKCKYAR